MASTCWDRLPEENISAHVQASGIGPTGDAEACDEGTNAGGQGDRVQQGIGMPQSECIWPGHCWLGAAIGCSRVHLGRCGLRMDAVGLAVDAAWSTWAMTAKVVPGVAKDAGLEKVSNADVQAAAAARERLAEAGLKSMRTAGWPSARCNATCMLLRGSDRAPQEVRESHPQARGSTGSCVALE